ncbi:MAG: anthrone oxygenase family protein [Pseudomonadota bacterium]
MFYGMNAWFLATLVAGALWWVAGAEAPSWRRLPARAGAQAYVSAWSRGGPALALLSLGASALGVAAALDTGDPLWAIAAATLFAAIPFTIVAMGGVGHALRDAAADAAPSEADVARLFKRWSQRHLIRCAIASLAVVLFIIAAH